ncbi:MAG: hypothetical protein H3C57_09165, partial [Gammaproteobacteria bacterium]|nr:hypothetical protein [Gammaproteobacteria bacterium]
MRPGKLDIGFSIALALDKMHLACGWQPQIMRGPAACLKPAPAIRAGAAGADGWRRGDYDSVIPPLSEEQRKMTTPTEPMVRADGTYPTVELRKPVTFATVVQTRVQGIDGNNPAAGL